MHINTLTNIERAANVFVYKMECQTKESVGSTFTLVDATLTSAFSLSLELSPNATLPVATRTGHARMPHRIDTSVRAALHNVGDGLVSSQYARGKLESRARNT